MLLALYTIFVLGGGGAFGPMLYISDAMDNTKTVIVDKDRRKEVNTSLKEMKGRASDYNKAVQGVLKGLNPDGNSHDVTTEELEAFWSDVFELNSQFSSDFVEMRFGLRDQLSRDEWEGIFPAEG